jgi:hypothetical protein
LFKSLLIQLLSVSNILRISAVLKCKYLTNYSKSVEPLCREQTVLCRLKKEARQDEDDLDLEPSRERDSDT